MKIRSTIYYPKDVKKALDSMKKHDTGGRSISQIVVDILLKDKELANYIDKVKSIKNEHK